VYGIKWAHDINGLDDPTKNSFVTSLQEAAKRVAPKKTDKKDPITTETLIELCEMHKDSSDLHVIRDLTMILLCFAGFLRYDEVSSLRVIDFDIDDSFLALHINKNKTDQYRQSNEVLISKRSTCACPFNMFIRYKHLASLSISSSEILFRPIYRSGKICRLIKRIRNLAIRRLGSLYLKD
jgi:integrase